MKKNIKNHLFPLTIILTMLVALNVLSLIIFFNTPKNSSHIASYTYVPDPNEPAAEQKDSLQLRTFKATPVVPAGNDCNTNQIVRREPYIVWAISPGPGESAGAGGKIKIWYNDENPLTLGSGNVSSNNADHVVDPNVGDESARDANNFPYFPALFLSDITTDSTNTSGDAENGGTPHKPTEVWGAWKPLGNSSFIPTPNNLSLPSGADPFPTESNIKFKEGTYFIKSRETSYGAEIIWEVDKLGLTSGHIYRAQFIVHDGDFDGDTSEGCTTIKL